MYQFLFPIGVLGVFIYYIHENNTYIKKSYETTKYLHDGTFDDFYIIDSNIDIV